jgi:hypothetical protein
VKENRLGRLAPGSVGVSGGQALQGRQNRLPWRGEDGGQFLGLADAVRGTEGVPSREKCHPVVLLRSSNWCYNTEYRDETLMPSAA